MLKDLASVTKEEILPSIYDDRNQLEVSEYVDEIYQHYWVTEVSLPPYLLRAFPSFMHTKVNSHSK